tara:strand:+ start:441 stop:1043 length:603 start_codon:yes stop_codon:yes gene_type:complete
MILNHDISKIISEMVCINSYHLYLSLALINKEFYNLTKALIKILSKSEKVFIATYIKNWRAEIDQKDYVHGEFMLLDDNYYIDDWLKDKSQNIRTSYWIKDRKLISLQSSIYNHYPQNLNWSETEYNLDEYKKSKQNLFEKYYIYYFYIDYRDCYCFDIYIYPYFDERLTLTDSFSHYLEVKKNKWCNHNIPKEYNGFDY